MAIEESDAAGRAPVVGAPAVDTRRAAGSGGAVGPLPSVDIPGPEVAGFRPGGFPEALPWPGRIRARTAPRERRGSRSLAERLENRVRRFPGVEDRLGQRMTGDRCIGQMDTAQDILVAEGLGLRQLDHDRRLRV